MKPIEKKGWKKDFVKLETLLRSGFNWRVQYPWTDFFPAFLSYKYTTTLLILFSTVLTIHQLFGNPISCTAADGKVKVPGLMETATVYCWIHSTYTVPINLGKVPHPGVAPVRLPINGGSVKRQKYYQWVFIVLFIQGIFFFIPRYFWKCCEDGVLQRLTKHITENYPEVYKNRSKRFGSLKKFFIAHLGYNYRRFIYFCITELLYLVNIICQIYYIDTFFRNEFTTYGQDILGYVDQDPETRVDTIEEIFPKVTKCTFEKYGRSGNIEYHDFICLLPFNTLNEKIYIFIWVWFVILMILTSSSVFFWFGYITSPRVRFYFFKTPGVSKDDLRVIWKKLDIADAFLLLQIKYNIEPLFYNLFIQLLAKESDIEELNEESKFFKPIKMERNLNV